jgi:hypothetical protein
MDNIQAGLLKSIDRLVGSLAKRVTFWPPVEDNETEELKLDFAHMLAEKYVEVLGLTKVANITRTSATEQDILETFEEELTLAETKELDNLLEDKENVTVQRYDGLFRGE